METRNVVQIFVSSPSDCGAERCAVQRAVKELNATTVRLSEMKIEVIDWDNLYPGIDVYPQQVINRQLPDYDIYVGLWRERFGTKTPTAPSGTLEELDEALRRYDQTRRPWVMCYFLESGPQDFKEIKEKLKAHGCLYHLFDDSVSFESMFREHLIVYLKRGFRPRGESTTRDTGSQGDYPNACIVLNISSPDAHAQNKSFHRLAVAIGRSSTRNDLVISDQRIHREQGLFVWRDGDVLYLDLAGDASYIDGDDPCREASRIGRRQITLKIGDAVELPDSTRITLKAVVD